MADSASSAIFAEPIVTIIVTASAEPRVTARQLGALYAQTERRWKLVILDPRPRGAAHPPWPADAKRISVPHARWAAAANRVVRGAETPFVAFLGAGATPAADWLAELLRAMRRHRHAAAISTLLVRGDDPGRLASAGEILTAAGFSYAALNGRRARALPEGEVFAPNAAAALYRTSPFNLAGGFAAEYGRAEGADLAFRLRLAGWRVVLTPKAWAVLTPTPGDASRDPRRALRNRLWMFVQNMPAPLLAALAPLHAAGLIGALAAATWRGEGQAAWAGLREGAAQLRGAWRRRKALQGRRLASVRDIAGALAWQPLAWAMQSAVVRAVRTRRFRRVAAPAHAPA